MQPTAALFITCLTDQFYPRVGMAITRVLEHLGWRVEFPQAQTCCGQPFFNNGFVPESKALAKRMIDIFEPYDYVVTPSGSCCAMVREQYHHMFEGDHDWERRMKKLSSSTYEFVEFLTKVVKLDVSTLSLPAKKRATYHFTCHLRALGLTDEGVRLLKGIGNIEFAPLEKTDQCCGFGGTFAVKYPEISGAIVADKVKCISQTQAELMVCNDAGCSMNISGMCHRHDVPTKVIHIAEILAEAMGIPAGTW